MPGFDGTGPRSMGPMTGRRMGRCVQPPVEGSPAGDVGETTQETLIQQPQVYGLGRGGSAWGCGRGFGGGRGGGRRRRW